MPRKRGRDRDRTAAAALTSKRRRRGASAPANARGGCQPRRTLPEDLLLEIVARSDDAAAVVRCAAASRSLRRAILDPAFRRRLADRGGAAGFCFEPGLLTAVYYRVRSSGSDRRPAAVDCVLVETSRPSCHSLRFGGGDLLSQPFQPWSSRDGLLVLRRNPPSFGLRVLNTFTGHVTSVPPPPDLAPAIYRPALLSVDDGGSSFELLLMDEYKRASIFSSRAGGKWRDVRHVGPRLRWSGNLAEDECVGPAAVVGRIVHWLSNKNIFARSFPHEACVDGGIFIIALDLLHSVDDNTAQGREIELPPRCLLMMKSCTHTADTADESGRIALWWCRAEGLLLHATAGGRLGLVVAEAFAISMWTLPAPEETEEGCSSSAWSRQVVIHRSRIQGQIGLGASGEMRFKGFGHRSGTVIVEIRGVDLVQLNLVTKNAVLLRRCTCRERATVVCIHEMELGSLLQHMKPF